MGRKALRQANKRASERDNQEKNMVSLLEQAGCDIREMAKQTNLIAILSDIMETYSLRFKEQIRKAEKHHKKTLIIKDATRVKTLVYNAKEMRKGACKMLGKTELEFGFVCDYMEEVISLASEIKTEEQEEKVKKAIKEILEDGNN